MKLSDVLFPRSCAVCGGNIKSGSLCESCTEKLCKLETFGTRLLFDGENRIKAYYIFEYGDKIVTKLLFALKQNSNRDLFDTVGKLTSVLCDKVILENSVITYVPRRKVNVRKYGYDHAEKIAKSTAKYCQKLTFERLLKRRGFSSDQKNLDSKQRLINSQNKFTAIKKDIPKNILLFDDVVTTGSSALSCIGELKKLYGNEVNIVCAFLASR